MELDGGIFRGEAWHIDACLDTIAAQDEHKNVVGHHCWNDGKSCGKETKDDVRDKVVHSIDEVRISRSINRFVGCLLAVCATTLSCLASCFTTTAYTLVFISRVCISIVFIYYTTVIISIISTIICSRIIMIII